MVFNDVYNELYKYLPSLSQIVLPYLYFTFKIWNETSDFGVFYVNQMK
jgi:hypothetical protein